MQNLFFMLFGIERESQKQTIDTFLFSHLVFELIKTGCLYIFVIVFGITSKQLVPTAVFFFVVTFLLLLQIRVFVRVQYGNFLTIEGPCKCTERNVTSVLKTKIFGKAEMYIYPSDQQHVYAIPMLMLHSYPEGTILRVYYFQDSVFLKDEDTYTISSPIFVTKVKNKPANTGVEQEEK